VARVLRPIATQLNRSEAGFFSECFCSYLVNGYAVVEALSGLRITISTSQVESAAPVGFARKLIGQILNNGEVLFVPL
jgi:hypothetical protein